MAIQNAIKSVSRIAYTTELPSLTNDDNLVLVTKGYVDTVAGGLAVGEGNGIAVSGTTVSVAGYGKNINVGANGVSATIPAWAKNTAYVDGDVVYNGSVIYVCGSDKAHTSGSSFDSTEKAYWTAISSTITSTSHTHTSAQISDGLTAYDDTRTSASYVVKTDGSTGKISSTLLPNLAITKVTTIATGTEEGGKVDGTTANAKGRFGLTTVEAGDVVVETYTPSGGSLTTDIYMYTSTTVNNAQEPNNWIKLEAGELSTRLGNAEADIDSLQTASATHLDKTTADGYYQPKGTYLTSSTGVTAFGGVPGSISVTGSNGLSFNTTSKTLSMSVATAISTANSDTNHYTSATAGSVKLATYKSGDDTNKGYWSTSGSDAFAATPKGVAAYTADTYQPKGSYLTSAQLDGYSSTTRYKWSITNEDKDTVAATPGGVVNFVRSRCVYAVISGQSGNTNKTYTITHNLGTNHLIVQVYDTSGNLVLVDTQITGTGTNGSVVIKFAEAPTTGSYNVYIMSADGDVVTAVASA